jgi:hypothetical protein
MDKCYHCNNLAEFKVLIEDDSHYPIGSKTEDMCGECLEKYKKVIIESWTKLEWLNWD